MYFAPLKSRERAEIQNMGVSKTSEYIQIKSQMPNLSQEPPMSFKALNQDYKDMDVFCSTEDYTHLMEINLSKINQTYNKPKLTYF